MTFKEELSDIHNQLIEIKSLLKKYGYLSSLESYKELLEKLKEFKKFLYTVIIKGK